ncbi:MAG: single-stranded-DNA-specific exonuclease RecJ [Bacillota bacterium]
MEIKYRYQADRKIPDWLLEETGGDELLAKLLLARDIDTQEDVRAFLGSEEPELTDPREMPALKEAVRLFLKTVRERKSILVYGDYDVDGIAATTMLVDLCNSLGADLSFYIPDRISEGYGLNQEIIEKLRNKVDLIITCDLGISNAEEIELARGYGIDVIVIDHHSLPEREPEASYLVTTRRLPAGHQAYHLTGAGLVYYFAREVLRSLNRLEELDQYLDLLALAIVADPVPLTGENRYLLKKARKSFIESPRQGLQALMAKVGPGTERSSFSELAAELILLIDSAGRLAQAMEVVELFKYDSSSALEELADKLAGFKGELEETEQEMLTEAREIIGDNSKPGPLIIYKRDWYQGAAGKLAEELVEVYQLPVIVMAYNQEQEVIAGSARSVAGLDIYDALKKARDLLIDFGGNAQAAGFRLEEKFLKFFNKKIEVVLNEKLKLLAEAKITEVDLELEFEEINFQEFKSIQRLEPFGRGNPEPVFMTRGCLLKNKRKISESISGSNYFKLIVEKSGIRKQAVFLQDEFEPAEGTRLDLIYQLERSAYDGQENIRLKVLEFNKIEADREAEVLTQESSQKIKLFDCRGRDRNQLKFDSEQRVVYYREGFGKIELKPVIDRYQYQAADKLVFLTLPPSFEIFKEIISATGAGEIYLAYSRAEQRREKKFIQQLAGILKGSLNKDGRARIDLFKLTVLTVQLEETIELGLRYLESRGYIDIFSSDQRFYWIRPGQEADSETEEVYKHNLKELLDEKRAFSRFMTEESVEKINDLIN